MMKMCRCLLLCCLVLTVSSCAAVPLRGSSTEVLPAVAKYYGLRMTIHADSVPTPVWALDFENIDNRHDPALADYLVLFEQEFSKMPRELIELSGLRTVVFVKHMSLGGQARTALPDYDNEVLYYDVTLTEARHARRVVHHEFYHMLEQQLFGSVYYKDPQWAALNPPEFAYGNGGASQRIRNLSAYTHPAIGFINGYAMSGLEEDKAEIWAILWLDHNWQQIQPLLKYDCVLVAKIRYLTAQMAARTPALPLAFWRSRFNPDLLATGCG